MDNSKIENYIDHIEDQIVNTPPEVREFLFSDTYKGVLLGFKKYFNLNDEQLKTVDTVVTDSLMMLESDVVLDEKLAKLGLPEDKKSELLTYISEYIVDPVLTRIENNTTQEDGSAPSPTELINRMAENKKVVGAIVPPKKIDPYREQV